MRIPDIIASLDAEWVNANKIDTTLPADENRMLSYQITILNRRTGSTSSAIIEPHDPTKRGRRGLSYLLSFSLRKALHEGAIPDYPRALTVVAHFARADLTHLRDWKRCCRRVDAVRGTFTTDPDHRHRYDAISSSQDEVVGTPGLRVGPAQGLPKQDG